MTNQIARMAAGILPYGPANRRTEDGMFEKFKKYTSEKLQRTAGKIVLAKITKIFWKSSVNFQTTLGKIRDLSGNSENVFEHIRGKAFL